MTQTHTPGPWRITTDFIGVYDESARRIANMDSDGAPDFDENETLANARLIAAAPELLQILEECLKRGWMWDNDPNLYTVANRVVREAKGK